DPRVHEERRVEAAPAHPPSHVRVDEEEDQPDVPDEVGVARRRAGAALLAQGLGARGVHARSTPGRRESTSAGSATSSHSSSTTTGPPPSSARRNAASTVFASSI